MIRREETGTIWVIHQMAHATIAGLIAQHWVGSGSMTLEPREELLIAALNHDAGWATTEDQPTINADGEPRTFTEMPLDVHFTIWERSITAVHKQNRYAGLLTVQHCLALYEMRLKFLADPPEDRARIDVFMTRWRIWQEQLVAALTDHPYYGLLVQPDALARNLRLVQVWDYLSLVLCMSPVFEQTLEDVPLSNEDRVTLRIAGSGQRGMALDPYPLDAPLTLWIDARQVLGGPFEDDAGLQAALVDVPYKPLVFEIGPL